MSGSPSERTSVVPNSSRGAEAVAWCISPQLLNGNIALLVLDPLSAVLIAMALHRLSAARSIESISRSIPCLHGWSPARLLSTRTGPTEPCSNRASISLSLPASERPKRTIVGVTGATGTFFAIRLLQLLEMLGIETNLITSKWAVVVMEHVTPKPERQVCSLATFNHTMKICPHQRQAAPFYTTA